jgi:general secretion pathway protein G
LEMNRRRAGFTLIEILVVLFIVSILASLLLVAIAAVRQRTQIQRTTILQTEIAGALERYQSDYRDYPPTDTEDGLQGAEQLYEALRNKDKGGPYLPGSFVTCDEDRDGKLEAADVWGRAFRYLHPRSYGRRNPNRLLYRLWSCGPDGRDQPQETSSDDLRNWNKAAPGAADGD